MANGGGGTGGGGAGGGGGVNPRDVSDVNKALQQQLVIMNQLRQAIASMTDSINQYCETSEKCFSGEQWAKATEQAGKYTKDTTSATKTTEELGKKVASTAGSFQKMMPAIGGVAGGIAGLRQGFSNLFANLKGGLNVLGTVTKSLFNLGRAVLAVPFNMLKGLQAMAADSGGGGGGGGSGMAEALENLRKEVGFIGPTSDAVKSLTASMAGFSDTGLAATKVFGNAAERMKYLTELAVQMGPQFAANAEEFKKNGGALVAYQKGLGLTGEQMGIIGIKAKSMGAQMGDVLNDMTKQALHMSKAFGLDAKVISKDMGKAMQDVAHFGHLTSQQLSSAVVYANKLGVSIDKLTGLMDQFDTFDKAAESTSKLNEQFGTNIDAMELMAAQSPAEKMEILRKSFQATGKDLSQLSFHERKLIQQQTGLDAATFDAAMAQKDQGDMLENINNESKKAESATLKQADAMKQLAVQIERIVQSGGGGGGGAGGNSFLDSFIRGFTEGITKSAEFQRVLINLKQSMKIVGKLGFDLGNMFIKSFPGISKILEGLADLFNPARYKKMCDGVLKAFKDFNSGAIKDFGGLMDRLKSVFFNFFMEGEAPGKKILEGFKKFFEAILKALAGLIKWSADQLANMIVKLVEMLKNPSSVGGMPGMGGFLKMLQPVIDAIIYAFNKLAPLVIPLLLELGKKIFAFLTSEQFLGFLKKAGPIIALVMFGPTLVKSLTGALTGALTAAATDAVRNAFLGPGSKKISEMTGKQFSELMSKATPPPAPAGAAGPIIPPGTPSPAETANAQATGKIIDGPTIIKLLLALAAIITIGLVSFYVAAQMVDGMDRKQIENALLVMGGVAIAIIPAAFALSLLSGIPAATLLAAIPALIAMGMIIPGMAALGVEIAKMASAVALGDILKALLLVGGMSMALIPAAYSLALLAGAGAGVVGGAPLILAALVALGLLVPAMALLGVKLAEMVANIELTSILKAITLLIGMSGALAIAAGAMAALIAAGALAPGVGVMILGIGAVGLIGFAMLELAPGLAEKASKVPLMQVLKALAIMGAMAVAIVEVIASMVLLAAAGVISLVMPVILLGIDAFKTVSMAMMDFAPELAKAASKVPIGPILKALIILAQMAVAVVEVLAQMVLLAGAGVLATLMIPILIGIEAFKLISVKMIEFAPTLGQVAQNVNAAQVAKALLVLGMMAISIAENVAIMVGLGIMGVLALLAPLIVLGMGAYVVISTAMLGAAKIFDVVASKIDGANVTKALALLGAMSISIAQAALNIVLLAALSLLIPIAPLAIIGAVMFKEVTESMMDMAASLDKAKAKINGDNVAKSLGILSQMSVAIASAVINVVLLAALGALIATWPLVKIGMVHFDWIIELMTEKMPPIVENINKLASLGLSSASGPIATLGAIATVMSTVTEMIRPMVLLARLKGLGIDIEGGMNILVELVTKITDKAVDVIREISKVPSSGMDAKVKAFAEILSAIGNLSNSIAGSIKNLDFGWFTSAKDKIAMMDKFKEILKTMMGPPGGIIGILEIVIGGISKIGASKETLDAAKTFAEILGAIGKLAEGMKPPPGLFEAAKEATASHAFMNDALKGISNYADKIGQQIGTLIDKIATNLLPALEKFKGTNPESMKAMAVVLEAIGKIAQAFQPPPGLLDAIKGADADVVYTIFDSMGKFMEKAGPVINSAISQIAKEVPPLVKAITDVPLSPQQIESVKVIGPIIQSLSSIISGMVGPAQAFMQAAEGGGGIFDQPKSFGDQLDKLTRVFDVLKAKIGAMLAGDGPIMGIITSVGNMDPKQVEAAAKIGPVISAIANVITAMMPKGEVLKAIQDAAKDEKKFKDLMDGIEKVASVIGDNIGKIFEPIGKMMQAISGSAITPEQVQMIEKLTPLIQSVISMTNGIVGGLKEGKVPSQDDLANVGKFFEEVGKGMSTMFEQMNSQIGKLIETLTTLLNNLKKQNIKPSEAKEGAEILKSAFDMIKTMGDVVKDIKGSMGTEPGKPPDAAPWKAALDGLKDLIEALFGSKDSAASKIVAHLSSPEIKAMGENKAGIEALMNAFKFISELPKAIEELKKASGSGGDINKEQIVKQVTTISEIFRDALTNDNISNIDVGLKSLSTLAAQKDKISGATEAFKNVASLAQELAKFSSNADIAKLDTAATTAITTGLTNVGTALDKIKEKAPGIGTALSAIKAVSDASGLAAFTSAIDGVITNANTIKTSIDKLDKAFDGLADPSASLGKLKTAIQGFSGAALTNSFKELQNIAKAVQDLDDALNNIGKIDIKQRIAKVAGGAGLDGGGVYTVKSKDVNVNIALTVTMEAGGIEKVILQNSNSTIKSAINITKEGLGKSGEDADGAKTGLTNLMAPFA